MNDEAILVSFITLYSLHSSLTFTIELSTVNEISFIGIEIVKNRTKLETQVYEKQQMLICFYTSTTDTDKHWAYALPQKLLM